MFSGVPGHRCRSRSFHVSGGFHGEALRQSYGSPRVIPTLTAAFRDHLASTSPPWNRLCLCSTPARTRPFGETGARQALLNSPRTPLVVVRAPAFGTHLPTPRDRRPLPTGFDRPYQPGPPERNVARDRCCFMSSAALGNWLFPFMRRRLARDHTSPALCCSRLLVDALALESAKPLSSSRARSARVQLSTSPPKRNRRAGEVGVEVEAHGACSFGVVSRPPAVAAARLLGWAVALSTTDSRCGPPTWSGRKFARRVWPPVGRMAITPLTRRVRSDISRKPTRREARIAFGLRGSTANARATSPPPLKTPTLDSDGPTGARRAILRMVTSAA